MLWKSDLDCVFWKCQENKSFFQGKMRSIWEREKAIFCDADPSDKSLDFLNVAKFAKQGGSSMLFLYKGRSPCGG